MIRVLHVISGMGSGGAEAMIMNWYRNIDRSQVQFDFLLRSEENIYKEEIGKLGGQVFYMPDFPKKIIPNYFKTKKFLKENAKNYAAIHVHCNALIYTNIFGIAKKYGIEKRIIHSHSTSTKSKLFLPLHIFNKQRISKLANIFLACSEEAGKWCFKGAFKVVNNSIDVERFKFNPESRARIREELEIGKDNTVLCHVGRFLPVKNHKKVISIFEKHCQSSPNLTLLLVGTGPLEEDVKKAVEDKGIENVLFLGVRKDIPDILSASDCFVFPSIYEGVSVSLIEAQANGLFCVASANISRETKVTNNIKYIDIDNSEDIWIDEINNAASIDRLQAYEEVKKSNYNIANTVMELQRVYLN